MRPLRSDAGALLPLHPDPVPVRLPACRLMYQLLFGEPMVHIAPSVSIDPSFILVRRRLTNQVGSESLFSSAEPVPLRHPCIADLTATLTTTMGGCNHSFSALIRCTVPPVVWRLPPSRFHIMRQMFRLRCPPSYSAHPHVVVVVPGIVHRHAGGGQRQQPLRLDLSLGGMAGVGAQLDGLLSELRSSCLT